MPYPSLLVFLETNFIDHDLYQSACMKKTKIEIALLYRQFILNEYLHLLNEGSFSGCLSMDFLRERMHLRTKLTPLQFGTNMGVCFNEHCVMKCMECKC